MEAAVYDLPLASLPTRNPRAPTEYPTPDFEKFSLSGPSLRLRRKPQPITPQFYPLESDLPLSPELWCEACATPRTEIEALT